MAHRYTAEELRALPYGTRVWLNCFSRTNHITEFVTKANLTLEDPFEVMGFVSRSGAIRFVDKNGDDHYGEYWEAWDGVPNGAIIERHKYTIDELKALPFGTWVWIAFLVPYHAWELQDADGVYIRKGYPTLDEDERLNLSWPGYAIAPAYEDYGTGWEAWNVNPDA